jgi:hypothetical protein
LQSSARPSLGTYTAGPAWLSNIILYPFTSWMNFSQLLLVWMKTAHLHPHNSQVCLVTSWTYLVIRNDLAASISWLFSITRQLKIVSSLPTE